jgi:hypothetical protein
MEWYNNVGILDGFETKWYNCQADNVSFAQIQNNEYYSSLSQYLQFYRKGN